MASTRGSARAARRWMPALPQQGLAPRIRAAASKAMVRPGEMWGAPLPDKVGSAHLDWSSLGFDYVPTKSHVRYVWKDGAWDAGRSVQDPYISVHILGNVFHYGQALFEGFKGFHTKQGDVCTFADALCHGRMSHGCRRFRMPEVPKSIWRDAVDACVQENAAFVPPYGSGGALYVRPFIFGSGPRLGLGPSPEYTFVVFANPVGSYYKNDDGKMQALDCLVNDDYDRAAPLGCGDCKAAGNYAADLESMYTSKRRGFPISLYLDAKERRYIEEFNTSNFVAITKDGRYLTPDAPRSVLDSNTNKVLRQLAEDMGITVEQRRIDFEAEVDSFAEVGAVGTAVVVTPIQSLTRGDRVWKFEQPKVLRKLRDRVTAIQSGEEEDRHGWMRKVSLDEPANKTLLSIYPGL
eukprot:TRINITY_DN12977_c0_g1_i2.p1 TRINITY_DN12977_c0_g1~~TRINITY_DN12977_c0_g1_i2.p1  ORF type:complete len:407 (-),score=68.13 TRINITY_DN12977_c0_g1_i2:87-1307(-)